MSIAVYIRGLPHTQNTDSQRAETSQWLHSNGYLPWQVTWYEEHESEKTTSRAQMSKLQKAVSSGNVEMVVIWKLDRLAGSMRDGIDILLGWCERGLRIVSVTQELDLSGPECKLVANLLFGLSKMEYLNVKDRQSAGIALAKKRGVYKGRKSGTTKAKPRRARELRDQGLKIEEIAAALGVSGRTVSNYLRN